jgi:hypothetical protein
MLDVRAIEPLLPDDQHHGSEVLGVEVTSCPLPGRRRPIGPGRTPERASTPSSGPGVDRAAGPAMTSG